MNINIYYHKSSNGREIIRDHIESLNQETQDVIYAFLRKFKNDSRFRQAPHSKKIYKDIFEIRIKVKDHFRILYAFAEKNSVILLHIFKKKTNKISQKDLKLAINRLKLYEE